MKGFKVVKLHLILLSQACLAQSHLPLGTHSLGLTASSRPGRDGIIVSPIDQDLDFIEETGDWVLVPEPDLSAWPTVGLIFLSVSRRSRRAPQGRRRTTKQTRPPVAPESPVPGRHL